MLRYFRKDGHNWRKKRDGKTVKEAHERLKVINKTFLLFVIFGRFLLLISLAYEYHVQAGSVDVLHCYYAHGQDNENFQRRSYWMLQE